MFFLCTPTAKLCAELNIYISLTDGAVETHVFQELIFYRINRTDSLV